MEAIPWGWREVPPLLLLPSTVERGGLGRRSGVRGTGGRGSSRRPTWGTSRSWRGICSRLASSTLTWPRRRWHEHQDCRTRQIHTSFVVIIVRATSLISIIFSIRKGTSTASKLECNAPSMEVPGQELDFAHPPETLLRHAEDGVDGLEAFLPQQRQPRQPEHRVKGVRL